MAYPFTQVEGEVMPHMKHQELKHCVLQGGPISAVITLFQ